MLSAEELEQFRTDGYLGVYKHPAVDEGSGFADALRKGYERSFDILAYPGKPVEVVLPRRLDSGMYWHRSSFMVIPEIWDLIADPEVVGRVTKILGPDVICWGASIIDKMPGDIHGWHFDAEYQLFDGVLVWVGIEGINERTTPDFITRTHHHRRMPVTYTPDGRHGGIEGSGILSDAASVYELAKTIDPESKLVRPPMRTGDFVLTDGKLWHGSKHEGDKRRCAVVCHYARPSDTVRIPITYDKDPIWYPKLPTCVLVAGSGEGAQNPLITKFPGDAS